MNESLKQEIWQIAKNQEQALWTQLHPDMASGAATQLFNEALMKGYEIGLRYSQIERERLQHQFECQRKLVQEAHLAFHEVCPKETHLPDDEYNIAAQIRIVAKQRDALVAVAKAAKKGQDDYWNYYPERGMSTDASDGDSRTERLRKNVLALEEALKELREKGINL